MKRITKLIKKWTNESGYDPAKHDSSSEEVENDKIETVV